VNKLLILAADAKKYAALIQTATLQELEIVTAGDAASASTMLNSCNIILGDPLPVSELLASAAQLEWVQSTWAGVDHLCLPGLRKDYVLTGAKGIFGSLISEYVMTYLFALERGVFTMLINQSEQVWKPLQYRPAKEVTIGIIGLGSIGKHLAGTARHFGIRVLGLNRSGKPCAGVEKVYTAADLRGFLEEPDYVVLTLPDTPATKNFINADVLGLMKPSTVLMNIGRGSIVNENDLVNALRKGIIGGAVLDVFNSEPLAKDSPLWNLPGVYVTPHNAATSFPEDIVAIFIDNYQRFLKKEPLRHRINFELGY
jgi:phosphoglycerate dehydrogenase-like enzyme